MLGGMEMIDFVGGFRQISDAQGPDGVASFCSISDGNAKNGFLYFPYSRTVLKFSMPERFFLLYFQVYQCKPVKAVARRNETINWNSIKHGSTNI